MTAALLYLSRNGAQKKAQPKQTALFSEIYEQVRKLNA